jgi:hypothetical protein
MKQTSGRVAARERATAPARAESFVGRQDELARFAQALRAPQPAFWVLHVYGPGGIGKSSLLAEFRRLAQEAGCPAVLLDGRNVAPTPAGFRVALAEAGFDLAPALCRRVLLIDTYELLAALDPWLRDEFLPALPDNILVVIAGREPPALAWRHDLGWQELTAGIELDNLPEADARAYLARRQVPEAQHAAALRFTRGYPLALSLLAEIFVQQPATSFSGQAPRDVVGVLLDRFLREVPSERARAALAACAIVRTLTEPLLAALLQVDDALAEFDWLRGLSFIYAGPRGIYPHDLAREALEADLKWRDPAAFGAFHRRAHEYYVLRMRSPQDDDDNYHDFVYLHKNPRIRAVFAWDQMHGLRATAPWPTDWAHLRAMVARHEGAESAALADFWYTRQPEGVTVIRRDDGPPEGFLFHLILRPADAATYAADPATAAAWRYIEATTPLESDEVASLLRFWMAADSYQAVSAVQGVAFVIAARHVITTPHLVRTSFVFADPPAWEAVMAHFDLTRLPAGDFTVGGHTYGVFTHDWRARPPMAWLAAMADREVTEELAAPLDAPSGPDVVLDQAAFAAAVRDALRDLGDRAALAANPLLGTPLVARRLPPSAGDPERAAALRAVVLEALAPLAANPRETPLYQALYYTYVVPVGSQDRTARRLGVPFSTFRRHLKAGTDRLIAALWALR